MLDPVVIAEIEFRQIAVKVLLVAMLVDALHAALENREYALDGIGVNLELLAGGESADVGVANIFVSAVVDGHVRGVLPPKSGVDRRFVGHHLRLVGEVGANDRGDIGAARASRVETAHVAAAFHKSEHSVLVIAAGSRRDAVNGGAKMCQKAA